MDTADTYHYQKRVVNYKNYKIQTYIFGTGEETVFAFPSFPHSGLYYFWFLNHYDLTKIKFITFDLPGWIGFSENIFATIPFSLEELVNIAKCILKTHHVIKYSVIGYSFGGALAVKLASDEKEKIKDVALVSSVINGFDMQNYKMGKLVSTIYKSRMSPVLGWYIKYTYHRYKNVLLGQGFPDKYMRLYEKMISQANFGVILTSIYTLFNTDWTNYLRNLRGLRILVANSVEEPLEIRKQAEHIRRVLRGCESLELHGGHADFILKPRKEIVKEVVNFLRR